MIRKHHISFKNAFKGLFLVIRTQPNYKIHFFLSIFALFLSWILNVSYFEFLLIVFLIIIGLIIETVNTAIEFTTDAIDKKIRDDIKIAKDVSASAMLIFSIGALIIGIIIFLPKIFNLFI